VVRLKVDDRGATTLTPLGAMLTRTPTTTTRNGSKDYGGGGNDD
jgi:hypothetical protein